MKKRLLSILLTLCMIVCILPTEVFALGGAAYDDPGEVTTGEGTYSPLGGTRYRVKWIQNDYIRLYIVRKNNAVFLATVPARTKASAQEAYQTIFKKNIYQYPFFAKGSEGAEISLNRSDVSFERYPTEDSPWTIKVQYEYDSDSKKYYSTAHYQITELDSGVESGSSAGGQVQKGDTKSQKTYGIKTNIDSGYRETPSGTQDNNISYWVYMRNFSKIGHPSVKTSAPLYMSTAVGNTADGFTNTAQAIPLALSGVKTNKVLYSSKSEAVTEVLTRGYSWANPFTLTSGLYKEYVEGFSYDDRMPDYFWTYDDGSVKTENRLELMGMERQESQVATLWGLRNLPSSDDDSFTPNDNVTIATSARHLGIYLKNNKYQAIPADNEKELTANADKYGKLIATLRGNYEEKNDRYVFSSYAAALSPTITATWSSGGEFSVGKDGSIALKHVSLNTPSFKFYQEKDSSQNGLSMAVGEDGLNVTMEPSSNSAVMSTDIAGTQVTPESATILTNGNIRFQGEADFSLFRGSNFTMEELGYGLKDGKFKFNGIRATGSVSTASMMGLDMATIEGTIDTFKPYYHFNMELNVFDLFESKAELELMQSKLTGTLMPNKIYFYAGSDAAKIPLVSPVVVAHISGAGGGIDNLATTFNGDFFAIPPINLSITGKGDVVNTLEATATYTFGPAYYKLVAEDTNITFLKKLNLIDEFSIYEGVQGETRNYNGTNYTGLKAFGGASIKISVPQKEKIIQAEGDINASAYGGLDSYTKPTKAYVNADLNGGIKGKLCTPKNWKIIGGKTIASTSFDFYLGASTVVNVRGTDFEGAVKSAYKNFKIYGGAKKEANWKIFKYRVYYIFPENDAGITLKGPFKKLPEWNWEDHKPSGYASYTDEDGALAVAVINMNTVDTTVTSNNTEDGVSALSSDFSKNVSMDTSTGETIPSDATTILMVTPQSGTDINTFVESLTVSNSSGQAVSLTLPQYNENDEIINEPDINAYITQNGEGNDCVLIGLGEGTAASDTWTVTSSMADFDASLNASAAFDSLNASLNGNTLTASINNPDTTTQTQSARSANAAATDYVLATYFGSASGEAEHLIDMQDVSDPNNISVSIPDKGTSVPTGSYYVTAKILKRSEVEVESEDGTTEMQEVLLPVDTKEVGTINYTNTTQPDAPAAAAIQPAGNEVMNASWSEVAKADGYKVTIYQKDGENFVDTGKGYSYDAADIKDSKINGISYDKASGKFVLDMALTVGGEDIDADGNKTQSQNGTLEAEKTYQVGVQAYKYLTDESGEKIDNSQVYSAETRSNDSVLPKYEPHDFDVQFQTLRGSRYNTEYVDHTVTDEDGVLHCTAGTGNGSMWYVTLPDDGANYTITRMDTGTTYSKDSWGERYTIDNSDITGSVTFQIDAQVDHGTYTDTTTKYLVVDKDETAPMLSINDAVVYADRETGEYTISGLTEPNTQVYLNTEDYDGNLEKAVMSDENGNFSYKGKLQLTREQEKTDDEGQVIFDEEGNPVMETVRDESGEIVGLIAEDENGNRSDIATAIVTLPATYSVEFDANGGTGTMDSVTGLTGTYTLPACGFTAPEGKEFAGWSTDPEGETMLSENIELKSDMTLYAIWQDEHKHSFGDWKSDDTNHWRECSCGEKSETAAHTASAWIIDTPATTDNVGKRHQECTVCKRVLKTDTIPVLNSDVIVNAVQNGTVTVSPDSAAKGSTVTITATPNSGYQLNQLTVTDASGNAVSFTDNGGGKYTFTMPNSKVTVNASFSKVKPKITFVDVPSDAYYADAVAWAVENEITNGTSATTFSPNDSCTRAQMVTFLWRANGSPKVSGSNPFVDVPSNEYYYDAVLWAVQKGITKGTSATTFDPNATVTRGQTVTFLWRASGSPEASGSSFSDVNPNEYYAKAVTWAVSKGITNGTGDGMFSPNDNCTRAQIVTLMYRQATK